ncbi:hypothetical protein AVEN_273083-1 [Araneus ventricosus]|uniref:Uncharacterized protein n=1 Tax=Araneus ventricosus TaxID=182803 RepID=A0A4Y2RFR8_ARAVE|nr:hypothetical protein AVEN_273083-1 [Araneus ventricosus]
MIDSQTKYCPECDPKGLYGGGLPISRCCMQPDVSRAREYNPDRWLVDKSEETIGKSPCCLSSLESGYGWKKFC